MRAGIRSIFFVALLVVIAADAWADNILFGGYPERFKGKGDRIPPDCQVTFPAAAAEPFFILWNCVDNAAEHDDLRSELWIRRSNDSAWELIKTFLGFPASIQVTPELLRAETVAAGLPAEFRLVGVDKAGNVSISKSFSIAPSSESVLLCDIEVITEQTETSSDGTTTGEPTESVVLSDVGTTPNSSASGSVTLSSVQESQAAPCEISDLCEGTNGLAFTATLSTSESSETTGTVVLDPGGEDISPVTIDVTGTVTQGESSVSDVSLEGTTTFGDKSASFTMNCSSDGSGSTTTTTTSTTTTLAEEVM